MVCLWRDKAPLWLRVVPEARYRDDPCAARLDFAAHGPGESDRPRRITMNKDAVRPHRQRLAVVGHDDALSEEEPDAMQHDSFIGGCHIPERPVKAHMGHAMTGRACNASERAKLVGHDRCELGGFNLHRATAEALAVREGNMRSDIHATSKRRLHRPPHDKWVASVEPAGDVCRGQDIEQRLIVSYSPGAEAFAKIGVEIDVHGAAPQGIYPSQGVGTRGRRSAVRHAKRPER